MKSRTGKVNRGFAVAASATVALLALTVSLGAHERASLNLTSSAQTECDKLAGSPYDQQRNGAFAPVGVAEIGDGAVQACQTAFDATGNPRFAYQLGRALNKFDEPDQAMTAYDTAVKDGYAAAMVNYGMLMGRLGDETAEFGLYQQAASNGNVLAAYNLGVAYRDGLGTNPDVTKALEWFEKAAVAGDDTAAFNIGSIYDEGEMIEADDQTAIAWYDLAAQRGNIDAMVNLGIMYETGEGIEASAEKAADMYRKAAEKGDTFAAYKYMEFQDMGVAPAPSEHAVEGVSSLVLKHGDVEKSARTASEI